MATEVVNARLYEFNTPGSLGVVKDTVYRRCYWPSLDQPTALFAEGSAGIQVEGPPTPRNVIFPPDTVFLDRILEDGGAPIPTRGDCFFLRERDGSGEEYVAALSAEDMEQVLVGNTSLSQLRQNRMFVSASDPTKSITFTAEAEI